MYYIVTYDITSPKRLPRALKTCRKYLHWVQNSVFEGELTSTQMDRLIKEMKRVIKKEEDSVIIYKARTPDVVYKEVIGIEKNEISMYI